MRNLRVSLAAALIAAASPSICASGETEDAVRNFRQWEYGMFIHYGMSTFTGREHQKARVDPALYAPTALDVDQWIRTARDAGMKYAVLTAKHTAGHCLWDSMVAWQGREFDYDVATSGDTNDVVAAFVAACAKHGLKAGLYYCLEDYVNNANYHVPKPVRASYNLPADYFHLAKDQLEELLRRHPSVSYLWLDIPVQASLAQRTEIYRRIKEQSPSVVVLFNTGMVQYERTLANMRRDSWPTDILNTEIHLPKPGSIRLRQELDGKAYELGYEHCDKIGTGWFWMPGEKVRPVDQLVAMYQKTRALGGNLLLNVPPDRTGRIPETHVAALMELKRRIGAGASVAAPVPAFLKGYEDLYRKDPRDATRAWFQGAKFGLFIHYGLYSLDGIHPFEQFLRKIPVREYEQKAARFTAEKFDADAICELAVEAGMKYVTMVAKHCEGFCLWDSKQTDFNSVKSAAGRDLVAEMVKACNERGLGFFAFYEHGFEWHHPHGPRRKDFNTGLVEVNYPTPEPAYAHGKDYDLNKYLDYASDQVVELLTGYGPIAGIWLDGVAVPLSGDPARFRCQELYDRIHALQPHALVSYKHGVTGTEDFKAPEAFQLKHIKPGQETKPAELCESLNPSWGYVKGEAHRSADWVWQRLAFTRAKGMNYLLNVGPLGDGSLIPADVATLKEVGRRLRAQGWPEPAAALEGAARSGE
jgi:alpha-L-fucosidase